MNLTLLSGCGQVKAEERVSIVVAAIARESEGHHWKLVLLLKHVDQGQPHILVLCHNMHKNSLMVLFHQYINWMMKEHNTHSSPNVHGSTHLTLADSKESGRANYALLAAETLNIENPEGAFFFD